MFSQGFLWGASIFFGLSAYASGVFLARLRLNSYTEDLKTSDLFRNLAVLSFCASAIPFALMIDKTINWESVWQLFAGKDAIVIIALIKMIWSIFREASKGEVDIWGTTNRLTFVAVGALFALLAIDIWKLIRLFMASGTLV